MLNYVITDDDRNLEIPGVYQETHSNETIEPSQVADGTYQYDIDYGSRLIASFKTRPTEDSNRRYWELLGYLKGRAWRKQTVYLDRLNGTIEAYIRITSADTNTRGPIRKKREMNIEIYEN